MALRVFELNVSSYPRSWRAHEMLGDAYARIGRDHRTAASYKKSLKLNPENGEARRKLDALDS